MVRDTKYVIQILILFIPIPAFWALFEQQGSRWVLQAIQLNRNVVSLIYDLKTMSISCLDISLHEQ